MLLLDSHECAHMTSLETDAHAGKEAMIDHLPLHQVLLQLPQERQLRIRSPVQRQLPRSETQPPRQSLLPVVHPAVNSPISYSDSNILQPVMHTWSPTRVACKQSQSENEIAY